jgi:hypothetical protein
MFIRCLSAGVNIAVTTNVNIAVTTNATHVNVFVVTGKGITASFFETLLSL